MTGAVASARIETGAVGTAPIPEELLAKVLEPYSHKGCRYLVDADYGIADDVVHARASFGIEESAYIRSTGHFNAVELVLCFNQLTYSAFAQGCVNEDIDAFLGWSIDDYCRNQLAGMLIKSASSRFKRQIDARRFSARLRAHDFRIVERTWRYLQFQSVVEFWDQDGGLAAGEFEIAVLNLPSPEKRKEALCR
ncbi:FcoT family thioesterase [Segniliparus rugosus]|uniref:(2E)-enoyl-[ACP] glycyltransferase n=1 Tax=Segniliparus rugosus (strain ATCC BAA-974 / DSM 45345 / CCUG 50838 / CIP 108380 / JCM 13579 / CDC 945) TaxID=679197 RepID=E5XM46_SEGRC|nr:FcoT family thioesterase [Segniliparus rugosus]EFV14577.1 hypothetical protein HMPREF9336_00566 [Segniliparus rugosus ATCC BAA-974]